jgi:hypothetical protein
MSHISERLVVHCPDRDASGHLAAFVAKHRADDGTTRITLRLPLRLFSEHRSLVERRVIATLYPLNSSRDPHPTYSVTWSPAGGGPFPEFAGALAVEKTPSDDSFGLIVSGYYEPPLGMVGALFDAALGRKIAHLSARDLLRSIGDHVENSVAHNEAARAGHRRFFPAAQASDRPAHALARPQR